MEKYDKQTPLTALEPKLQRRKPGGDACTKETLDFNEYAVCPKEIQS